MVNYEEEYDKYEDVPNNIDYGSWYEYDNFQDFLDGKNAMDLTEGEVDFLDFHIPEEDILDFNELRDDEAIYREEYVNFLIERKLNEEEGFEELLKSLENEEIDYEHLEKMFSDEKIMEMSSEDLKNLSEDDLLEKMIIEHLIENRLLEEKELNKEFLKNKSLEEIIESQVEDIEYEESYDDFPYDEAIEEKYYEHMEFLDELHYKIQETNKRDHDDVDLINEITDYGDNNYSD